MAPGTSTQLQVATLNKDAKVFVPNKVLKFRNVNRFLVSCRSDLEAKILIKDYLNYLNVTLEPCLQLARNASIKFKEKIDASLLYANEKIQSHSPEAVKVDQNEFVNFKYTTILKKSNFNAQINDNTMPTFKNVNSRLPTKSNAIEAYTTARPVSFMNLEKIRSVIGVLNSVWDQLSEFDRSTWYFYLFGFNDNFEFNDLVGKATSILNQETTRWTPKVEAYVNAELAAGRLIDFGREEPFEKYVASKIIAIEEMKTTHTGESYNKTRIVYNNVAANSIIKAQGTLEQEEDMKFTTPTVEVLFRNDKIFERLINSSFLSVFDKESFYRQFYIAPESWPLSVIIVEKKRERRFLVDICGRMGNKSSSIYAQRLSNGIDNIYNQSLVGEEFAFTNQDDTLIFRATPTGDARFKSLSVKLGIKLNAKKDQPCTKVVEWCGSCIDVEKKRIRIKPTRIEKARKILTQIQSAPESARREYARIMGMIWSANIIYVAKKSYVNALLYFTRKYTFLHQNFINESCLNSEFYDVKIKKNNLVLMELNRAVLEMGDWVSFEEVRRGLQVYDTFGKEVGLRTMPRACLFVDSSDSAIGIGVWRKDDLPLSFRIKLEKFQVADWSINFKESLAISLGVAIFAAFYPRYEEVLAVFTDNTAAQAVASTRKSSLKNLELALNSKLLCALELTLGLRLFWLRVPSELNVWSDALSREKVGQLPADVDLLGSMFDLIIGGFPGKCAFTDQLCQLLGHAAKSGRQAVQNQTQTGLRSL